MNLARLGTQLKLHEALRLSCALAYDCGFKPTLQATNMNVGDMILMCRLNILNLSAYPGWAEKHTRVVG